MNEDGHFPWLVGTIESIASEYASLGGRADEPGLLEPGWRERPFQGLLDVLTSIESRLLHARTRPGAKTGAKRTLPASAGA